MYAGSESGMKGYFLTFAIAYIRDYACQHCYVAESFETSVPWSKVSSLCQNVKERLKNACLAKGIPENKFFGSFRVTQLYETGAAVYVYFGYNHSMSNIPKDKVIEAYEEIENECRDEVMKQGGSLSHHHGIGKIRKRFMDRVMTPLGLEMMKDMKKSLDPNNIFAINNTIYKDDDEQRED